ncbi:hypothetical protein [Pseudomonas soli]|uniref:hypothetical protein n=1 Tax=Pseudomonas soli TaxID=1306993 RepID=UPI0028A7EFAA|nr:hypothetical protein [Pseudomonas soli]
MSAEAVHLFGIGGDGGHYGAALLKIAGSVLVFSLAWLILAARGNTFSGIDCKSWGGSVSEGMGIQ